MTSHLYVDASVFTHMEISIISQICKKTKHWRFSKKYFLSIFRSFFIPSCRKKTQEEEKRRFRNVYCSIYFWILKMYVLFPPELIIIFFSSNSLIVSTYYFKNSFKIVCDSFLFCSTKNRDDLCSIWYQMRKENNIVVKAESYEMNSRFEINFN